MSEDNCCGDLGNCCDNSGRCDGNAACMDSSRHEEATTFMETEFSDTENICFDRPFDTYSCDGGYCYEDTYQPVYSSLSRNNNTQVSGRCERIIIGIIIVAFTVIICKLNICIYALKFMQAKYFFG